MKRNIIDIRTNYLKNNSITLHELNALSDDACVRLNRNYFHFLLAIAQTNDIQDKNVLEVFSKYLQIEKMHCFVHKTLETKEFYLMSAEEARILINSLDTTPWKNSILKCETTKTRLFKMQTDLQDLYRRKKKGIVQAELQKKILKRR